MKISLEQAIRAQRQFEESIDNVDQNDIIYAVNKGQTELCKMRSHPPSALAELWEDIETMVALISDHNSGIYTAIDYRNIAAITGAIIYFVSPIDVIPDFIPDIGYEDDALVIKIAIEFAKDELTAYRNRLA